MFKKVLWATDGSDCADQALSYAKALVSEDSGELLVIHCVEFTMPGKGGGSLTLHADEDELTEKIERQVRELTESGLSARLDVLGAGMGGAAHTIAEAARDNGADVIVLGTRGHTPLGGLLLGGVTQRLLHIMPCPVLAVPATSKAAA